MEYDYLIVGAGFFGAVVARNIADDLNATVCIIDKRDHIAGNCFSDYHQETDILYHKYGTHIFHTSYEDVWNYISPFMELNNYKHQVLTTHKNQLYQMPINLETINSFYSLNLKPYEVDDFLNKERAKEFYECPKNLEEKAISMVGRPLYEAFIKGYTKKQWQADPKELPESIINRLPVRKNYDETYFLNARWEGIPIGGYTKVVENILDHKNITTKLNCDYFTQGQDIQYKNKLIYTGPIDQLFNYEYGKLEWRSVSFTEEVRPYDDYQGTSVINYADEDVQYTRIHEPKHLHPDIDYTINKSLIIYEHPGFDSNDPAYPINSPKNSDIFNKYKTKVAQEDKLIVGGRLGDYAYNDMDKTILAALKCFKEEIL